MGKVIASTYELIREIGSGGGGVVYLGRHLNLNKKIVLKADKRSLTAKTERLRQEVETLKNLTHSYIPTVYDYVQEDGVVYTVMDYIEGESLDNLLERGEKIPQRQVVEWACELLEALCYLHSRPPHGILHADIKPANIMITPDGEIRLIDYNIALALGENGAVITGYSEGYASPEHYLTYASNTPATRAASGTTTIAEDTDSRTRLDTDSGKTLPDTVQEDHKQKKRLLDVRSDIYCLGATLYHVLTGVVPEKDARKVIPIDHWDNISPPIREIIKKAMQPEPELRYQSAAEMLYDFEHLRERDPRTQRWRKTRTILIAVLSACFFLGALTTFGGQVLRTRSEQMGRRQAEILGAIDNVREQIASTKAELLGSIFIAEEAITNGNVDEALRISLNVLAIRQKFDSETGKALGEFCRDAEEAGDTEAEQHASLAIKELEQLQSLDTQAQCTLTNALGVYDLTDGFKAYKALELPSEVIKQSLSSDGRYAAYLTSGQVNIVELASASITAQLPANVSALTDVVFFENLLIFAGVNELCAYDVTSNQFVWKEKGDYTAISLSGDGKSLVAAQGGGDGAHVFAVQSGERIGEISFGDYRRKAPVNPIFADPQNDIFTLDSSGNYLAVSFDNGALMLLNTKNSDDDIELFQESEYLSFEGGFYGRYFGFTASDGANTDFVVIDLDALDVAGNMSVSGEMHMIVSDDGFCLSQRNVLVRLDVETGKQTEIAYTESGISAISRTSQNTLIKAVDGKLLFFDSNAILFDMHDDIQCDFADITNEYAVLSGRDSPSVRILKLETHDDKQAFSYDADYAHDEARVRSDGSSVMLFSYKGFRIYDADGDMLYEIEIPDAENVYDQQYRRNASGDFLEILYYDGTIRRYSATDSSLIAEEMGTEPDKTLYEEFETESFRISSPLHGTPMVYDAATETLIKELQSEDYLTYVTEVNEGLITEYIKASGERYGLLLDGSLETLAYLPNLCDILPDGTLLFDDTRGTLRQSRIYSVEELIALSAK